MKQHNQPPFSVIPLLHRIQAQARLPTDHKKVAKVPIPQPTQDSSGASFSIEDSVACQPEEELQEQKEAPLEEEKHCNLAARHRRFPSANIPYQMRNPHTNIGRLNHTALSVKSTNGCFPVQLDDSTIYEGEENIAEIPSAGRKPAAQSPTKCMIVHEQHFACRSDSTGSGSSRRPSSHTSAAEIRKHGGSNNSSPISLECTETLCYEEPPQNKENMPPARHKPSEREERKRSLCPPREARRRHAKEIAEEVTFDEEEEVAREADLLGLQMLCAEQLVIPGERAIPQTARDCQLEPLHCERKSIDVPPAEEEPAKPPSVPKQAWAPAGYERKEKRVLVTQEFEENCLSVASHVKPKKPEVAEEETKEELVAQLRNLAAYGPKEGEAP